MTMPKIITMKEAKDSFITVTKGMSGYFAVHMWLNTEEPDIGPFWEPWESHFGRYTDKQGAIIAAMHWAIVEGMDYLPPPENL